MSAYRAVLLVLLVVGGSLAVAAPTSAAVDSRTDSAEQRAPAESGDAAATDARFAAVQSNDSAAQNDSANSSLGGDISSFMQSSAAEIGGAVETGMWSAEFNATADRSRQRRLVERRTNDLRTELDDLQERKAELVAERDEGNVSEAAYKARIGQLLGRIDALQSAINATEPRARQVDTNVDALAMLESDTRNLTGPEIAAVARNTTGVGNGSGPPAGVGNGNGPPGDVGNGSNGVGNGSNGVGGPPDDVGDGPLEDAGNGSGIGAAGPPNGTPGGPPDGVGNGNGNGTDVGNGLGVGNGTDVGNGANVGNGQGPPTDAPARGAAANWTAGPTIGANAATFAESGFGALGGPAVGLDLASESFGWEPVSDAIRVRTSAVLRTLPFA